MSKLSKKTIIITGASRGIGREIALKLAQDGANLVLAAKSTTEGKLPGTIYSVAKEVEALGGTALPLQVDVRDEASVQEMANKTIEKFGCIDGLINNAGAIQLTQLESTPPKRMDLMLDINVRAVLMCSHYCIPHLKKNGGHIINLSPPLSLNPKWYGNHVVYSISKYGMSMATIGMAAELKEAGVAVNSLWPRTIIATAAVNMIMGETGMEISRTPAIMADAAYEILITPPKELTGQTLLDEDFLKTRGYTNFEKYTTIPGTTPALDLFVEN
ncbi:NAD(P)-dependent oxidoreductase [bacterium]|nr:NAD(P)-dependent oxidoreductase [bacterium]